MWLWRLHGVHIYESADPNNYVAFCFRTLLYTVACIPRLLFLHVNSSVNLGYSINHAGLLLIFQMMPSKRRKRNLKRSPPRSELKSPRSCPGVFCPIERLQMRGPSGRTRKSDCGNPSFRKSTDSSTRRWCIRWRERRRRRRSWRRSGRGQSKRLDDAFLKTFCKFALLGKKKTKLDENVVFIWMSLKDRSGRSMKDRLRMSMKFRFRMSTTY